jgi:hypothetical protein
VLLDRVRIELLDGVLSAQPYHEAAEAGLSTAAARAQIQRVERLASKRASAALALIVAALEQGGLRVAGIAVVATDRVIPDELDRVLRSHQLLHSSEGDLFEEAILDGASSIGRPVARVSPPPTSIHSHVEALGRSVGAPWQKDHKLAAMAAFTLLA